MIITIYFNKKMQIANNSLPLFNIIEKNKAECQVFHAPFDVCLPKNSETADLEDLYRCVAEYLRDMRSVENRRTRLSWRSRSGDRSAIVGNGKIRFE
jgi:hypothetical protein